MKRLLALTTAALLFSSPLALAGDATKTVRIEDPTLRATLPGQKMGAGYGFVLNPTQADDRLVGGKADFAKKVEIHETKMKDGAMSMIELGNGLELTAGKTAGLLPGGYHIMFMGLKEPLKAGETRSVTLMFEKAGEMEIDFIVKSVPETLKMKDQPLPPAS